MSTLWEIGLHKSVFAFSLFMFLFSCDHFQLLFLFITWSWLFWISVLWREATSWVWSQASIQIWSCWILPSWIPISLLLPILWGGIYVLWCEISAYFLSFYAELKFREIYLQALFPFSGWWVVPAKVVFDQTVWAAVWNSIYYAGLGFLRFESSSAIFDELKATFWPMLTVSNSPWSYVHNLLFKRPLPLTLERRGLVTSLN